MREIISKINDNIHYILLFGYSVYGIVEYIKYESYEGIYVFIKLGVIATTNIFMKNITEKYVPTIINDEDKLNKILYRPGTIKSGLPSGHCMVIFSIIPHMNKHYSIFIIMLMYSYGIFIMGDRISKNKHTTFQVLVGSLVGLIMGISLFWVIKSKKNKKNILNIMWIKTLIRSINLGYVPYNEIKREKEIISNISYVLKRQRIKYDVEYDVIENRSEYGSGDLRIKVKDKVVILEAKYINYNRIEEEKSEKLKKLKEQVLYYSSCERVIRKTDVVGMYMYNLNPKSEERYKLYCGIYVCNLDIHEAIQNIKKRSKGKELLRYIR